jgi:acetyltransferase EpsM
MTPLTDLVFLGAGGHAAEMYSYLSDLQAIGEEVNLLGAIDEVNPSGPWEGSRILGDFGVFAALMDQRTSPLRYITAVGDNALRRKLVRKAEEAGRATPWTLRHPTALVGRSVRIGVGTLLAPGSIVTTRTEIGRHCILNVKATVSHDCVLGDYVNINPNATIAGWVHIGEGAFVGAGATVIDHVSVGEWSIVGAGTVVIDDIPSFVTAVGVPARIIKRHQPRE